MVALIPEQVAVTEVIHHLMRAGLPEISRGKVRHTFELPGYPGLLLQYASDRISIFDWVLPALVQDKGAVLTAMTVFWLKEVLADVPNHLVAYGSGIDAYLPEELRDNRQLHAQAVVVKKLEMIPVECIVRGYLTGSGWAAYQNDNGVVCGIQLSEGLYDGSQLIPPIFTPTTKAEVGHDEHLEAGEVIEQYPGIDAFSLEAYDLIKQAAGERGFAFADTKFELGAAEDGTFILGDEVGTPDSSRFWDLSEWLAVAHERKAPPPHDKQFVREWGLSAGVSSKLSENNPEDVAFVHGTVVPDEILATTTDIYRKIAFRMLGMDLQEFQRVGMGIPIY